MAQMAVINNFFRGKNGKKLKNNFWSSFKNERVEQRKLNFFSTV